MAYDYPYGNGQQLNLDWFLEEWKNLLAAWEAEKNGIEGALQAEIDRAEAALADVFAARDAAAQSAANALESKNAAAQSAEDASGYLATVRADANTASNAARNAAQSESNAADSAQTALASKNNAADSASAAAQSEANARANKDAAAQSAADALANKDAAAQSAADALANKDAAAQSASDAEDAAASVSASTQQIATNTSDITNLKESTNPLLGVVNITGWTEGYYINDSGVVTQNSILKYSDAIPVKDNTLYNLTGERNTGASNVRIYGYNSENLDDRVQSLYSLSQDANYDITFNTRDATYIRISIKIADTNVILKDISENIKNQVESIETYIKGIGVEFSNWQIGKTVTTNVNIGEYVDTKLNNTASVDSQTVKCTKGDIFFFAGLGAGGARAWAFLNNECYLQSKTNTTFRYEENLLTAPTDGWLVVNAYTVYDGIERNHKLIKIYDASNIVTPINAPYNQIIPPEMPSIFETISELPYNPNTLNWQTGDPSTPRFKGAYDRVIAGYDALVNGTTITKTSIGYDQSGTIEMFRYDFIPALPITNSNVDYAQKITYTIDDYPVVITNSGIHGNEKPDVYALLNLMTLIATAKDNTIFGWLRENIHFVVVPFENPYGFQYDLRGNVNNVDINRNFPVYWDLDSEEERDDPTSTRYRGASAGSEAETQHIISILNEFKNKAICYYSWHTHGVFTSFARMTCYQIPKSEFYNMSQNVGYALIKAITNEGWKNHELDASSGFIGILELATTAGIASNTGVSYGIPSACPECMYRYYDGQSGAVLTDNNVNCMNVEYILYAIALMIKAKLY